MYNAVSAGVCVCGGVKGVVSEGGSMALDVWAYMCGYGVGIARQSIAMSCVVQCVLVMVYD